MSDEDLRYPLLDRLYQQYLNDENAACFIQSISRTYTMGTLERLGEFGQFISRRAAILAIGFLGDYASNETMGAALVDSDRAVRLLADHGIRQIWQRQGTASQQQLVRKLYRLIATNQLEDTVDFATDVLREHPGLGEVWNQRAIAFCGIGDFDAAIEDCRETLNCNRYHFPSAMGMAHCCLHLDNAHAALDCFRLALSINPDLEGVRNQIMQLERTLDI